MADNELFARVVKVIKPFVKNHDALAHARAETRILEDLKVNSARLVDIILELENEFAVELSDDDADKVRTIGDAVLVIEGKTAS